MTTTPTTQIVVKSNGTILTITDKHLSAPPEIRKQIKEAEQLGLPIRMGYNLPPVTPNTQSDDPVEQLAALFAPHPTRTQILEVPKETWKWFDRYITEANQGEEKDSV